MSYQVLARKWRPKRFSEMVGQQHVLKALENALNQNRLHHAYLFTGTRGVGKTTIARIFAKCLNCESGVSAEPCGTCSICQSVDQGRFLDLMEIDAASHTGVDAIRDLLDNTQYTPTQGKYKVYLIDEVHMLSGSAFNALLKTLEEPPEHVKFLLATTDPQKLPVTVLSRCLQFNLKAMAPTQISEHLKSLLEKEMIGFEEEALELIAKAADGSMRDALSLTDQAIAHGNESLKAEEVRGMLGMVDRAYIRNLIDALLAKDAKVLLDCVEKISMDSPNYSSVLVELIDYMHRLIVEQVTDADTDRDVKEIARQFTAEELQLYYQIALKGRADLAISPDARQGLEICLLRMVLFSPEKVMAPSAAPAGSGKAPPVNSGSADPKAGFQELKAQIQKKKPEPLTRDSEKAVQSQTEIEPGSTDGGNATVEPVKNNKQPPVESTAARVLEKTGTERFSYKSIPDKWTQIVISLDLKGPALQIAKNSNFKKVAEGKYHVTFDRKFEMLATEQARNHLSTALNDFFGAPVELDVSPGELAEPSPEQLCQALDIEKMRFAEKSILEDDVVRTIMDEFDAQLLEGSAKLLN